MVLMNSPMYDITVAEHPDFKIPTSDSAGRRSGSTSSVAQTTAGRELLDDYRDEVATLERRMVAGLGTDETSQLRHSLHACHANLSSDAGQTTI
jgi:hypothetical protein